MTKLHGKGLTRRQDEKNPMNLLAVGLLNLREGYFGGVFHVVFAGLVVRRLCTPRRQWEERLQKGSGSSCQDLEAGRCGGCSRLITDSGWSSARCVRS